MEEAAGIKRCVTAMRNVKQLPRARFNAYVNWIRSPGVDFVSEELDWYADEKERVIGVVLRDIIDNDFVYVVLGRDETGVFRCIDVKSSLRNVGMARSRLKQKLQQLSFTGETVFAQGDREFNSVDLFIPVVPEGKLSPLFKHVATHSTFQSARKIMTEMMRSFKDVDGNFVEQFQTAGFDARVWELYLYAYLREERLFFDRKFHAPDYVVTKYGKTVCIEATIVGAEALQIPGEELRNGLNVPDPQKMRELLNDYIPLKFGSPLYSKLNKNPRYWDLEHAKGNPFVIAIADFHDRHSMLWTYTGLVEYLYGARHDFSVDPDGQLIISPLKIETHKKGNKDIPSGFFFLPEAENVSAVMFSSTGTISKFNRMGRLAGFGDPNIRMFRYGAAYKHDQNSALPEPFGFEVRPGSVDETWGEGLNMYHNPRAINPVPLELFPSIAHHRFEDGLVMSQIPEFHPYWSVTHNYVPVSGGKDLTGAAELAKP